MADIPNSGTILQASYINRVSGPVLASEIVSDLGDDKKRDLRFWVHQLLVARRMAAIALPDGSAQLCHVRNVEFVIGPLASFCRPPTAVSERTQP
jgi:hypothetical protein